jgi:spermidine synthase
LFGPFLAAGISITALLASRRGGVNRMYAADLLGAGLGCALAVPLLILLNPPGTVFVGATLLVLAGIPLALTGPTRMLAPALGVSGVVIALAPALGLPDPVVDPGKQLSKARAAGRVLHSEWSPVFRVDVYSRQGDEGRHWLAHDGQVGSTLHPFDGDPKTLSRFDVDPRSLPFAVIDSSPRVLIIGSAGGHEILASLHFEAGKIDAVELNPATLRLLTDSFADYSGRLHENARVTLVNAEGRSFLNRGEEQYDLIWLVAPDSYAAMNAASAGAFVLSESYLYTVEMIRESLEHLTPNGVLCAQFGEFNFDGKPNRTARFLASAREALSEMGERDFPRHVLLATTDAFIPVSTVVLGRTPFSRDRIESFSSQGSRIPDTQVRHASGLPGPGGPVDRVIHFSPEDLESWFPTHRYDLSPVTDDSPFFWHFVRFRHAFRDDISERILPDWEDAIGERVQIVLLGMLTTLAAVFLLLPLVVVRTVWKEVPWKAHSAVYFASLGMGFMLIEVCLIQMLTLFLGYPTYSLSVTLFGVLIFSGLGSALSARFAARRNRALVSLLVTLAALVVLFQVGLPLVVDALVGAPLALRIAVTVAMIAPLGLCLGAFLPLGLETVAALTSHSNEYVAWAWAINGFFSVITATLSTMLAMSFGFRAVLLLGLAIYTVGVLAMLRVPAAR